MVLLLLLLLLFLSYIDMTVDWAQQFEQTINPISRVGPTWSLVDFGQVVSEEMFNNIMILYMYTAQKQGKISLAD